MSRDYAIVAPSIWTGETGRSMRGDPSAQITALFLVTCQHASMIGIFHCPPIFIAYETGLALESVLQAIQRLSTLGFCEYDASREIVWVREMAKYQIAPQLKRNDNRVAGIIKEFRKIPDCQIKQSFYDRYKDAFFLPSSPETTSPFEAPCKPLRSQEQDQDQEQEQDQDQEKDYTSTVVDVGGIAAAIAAPTAANVVAIKAKAPPCPYGAIRDLYHEILPELRGCRDVTEARKGYLRQRWHSLPGPDLAKWRAYFAYVRESQFLMGQKAGTGGRPPFEADFEWLIKPKNFTAVCEGKYHEVVRHG